MEFNKADEGKTFIVAGNQSRSPLGQFMCTTNNTVWFPTKYGMFYTLLNYKSYLVVKLSKIELDKEEKDLLKGLKGKLAPADCIRLLTKAIKALNKTDPKVFSKAISDELFLAAKCRFMLSEHNWLKATSNELPLFTGAWVDDELKPTHEAWNISAYEEVRKHYLDRKGNKTVTGIGTREPPKPALKWVSDHAGQFSKYGYVLRSGHADGMDLAFERAWNCFNGRQEIFVPDLTFNNAHRSDNLIAITDEEMEFAWNILEDTGVCLWRHNLKPFVQRLLARNVLQVLGRDFSSPSDCVVYYCKLKDNKPTGGTAYAVNLATALSIPSYHIGTASQRIDCECYLVRLCE